MTSYNTFGAQHTHTHTHAHPFGGEPHPWEEEHTHEGSSRFSTFLGGVLDAVVYSYCMVIGLDVVSGGARAVVSLIGWAAVFAHASATFGSGWHDVTLQNERDAEELNTEREHLLSHPSEEDDHISKLLQQRFGLSQRTAEMIITDAKASPEGTLRLHSKVELGLDVDKVHSGQSACTYAFDKSVAFVVGGLPPLVPFMSRFHTAAAFWWSSGLCFLCILLVGAYQSSVTSLPKQRMAILRRHVLPCALGFGCAAVYSYAAPFVHTFAFPPLVP